MADGRQPYRDNIHANDGGQALIAQALLAYLAERSDGVAAAQPDAAAP